MDMQQVLIAGAGPTGLVLALWLTRLGVPVRIIDRSSGPGLTSRALAVQARTLELYRQLDLAEAVVAAGHVNPAFNLWARGKKRAHVSFGEAGADLTPYPFVLIYPQDRHEVLLIERLRQMGVEVERQTELISFEDKVDHVVARLRLPDGSEESVEARYLSGCDGAKSPIRHQLGNQFEGGTYKRIFYVADVEIDGLDPDGELHIALDLSDFVAVLSYGKGGNRLIGTIEDETDDGLTFEDVGHRAIDGLGISIRKVNWFSTYRVHHRVTDRFRVGNVFLVGDAAHVHSPAGGQGMNTGISDAINLAWKLAAALSGKAGDALLDSYDVERQAFARTLVDTTDKVFSFATADGGFADFVRTRIAPAFVSVAYHVEGVRDFMFRILSQTLVQYRDSPLSEGKAGAVDGGDRLPWVKTATSDNYAPLSHMGWQVHVYGAATAEVSAWCAREGVPLHVFAWTPEHRHAGLEQDALYLLRPDTWVALSEKEQSADVLERYFAARLMRP
ncbi:MAG: FAD-dependent oxidoreductase [Alphaproteobacteria bacterium]|nr:MAG: FAD-dependent oxidoreductase [Alphaproteobacteria bacterium]